MSISIIFVCILSSLLLPLAVFYIYLKLSKRNTFAKSWLFIGVAFCLALSINIILTCYVDSSFVGHPDWVADLASTVSKSIKMLAMALKEDDFFKAVEPFSNSIEFTYVRFFVVYLAQVLMFLMASVTVISGFFKVYKAKRSNIKFFFRYIFRAKGLDSSYTYTRNIIYTDLDYKEIKPFIDSLKNNKKALIQVVVPKSATAKQYGAELLEQLKLNDIDVFEESLSIYAMKKFSGIFKHLTVNFYGLFLDDKDNLQFAEKASEYLTTIKRGIKLKNAGSIHFYVSFQDTSFNSKVNFAKDTNDCIQLVNEYDWVASKFVFENPITRFVNCEGENFGNKLREVKNFNVHFLGFGNIAKSLADKIYANYQLPEDISALQFHFVDKNKTENQMVEEFVGRYQTLSKIYNNESLFYPQKKDLQCFEGVSLDVLNDTELHRYARKIVLDIANNYKNDELSQSKHLVFISLGSEQDNISVANKLRSYIKNIADSLEENVNPLLRKSSYKSVIIYPYVKSNEFFKQGQKRFDEATSHIVLKNILRTDASTATEFCAMNETEQEKFAIDVLNYWKDKSEPDDKQYAALFKSTVGNPLITNQYEAKIKSYSEIITKDNYYEWIKLSSNERKSSFSSNFLTDLSYVFEIKNRKSNPALSSKNKIKKALIAYSKDSLLSNYYKAAFKFEECPIVIFGRGGYLSDPLRDAIVRIAKMVNASYCDDSMNADSLWNQLSYDKKQSNIGAVLSLPARLDLLNLELKWDKANVIYRYSFNKNKTLKSILNFRYRHYIACYESFSFAVPTIPKISLKNLKKEKISEVDIKKSELEDMIHNLTPISEILKYYKNNKKLLDEHCSKEYKKDFETFYAERYVSSVIEKKISAYTGSNLKNNEENFDKYVAANESNKEKILSKLSLSFRQYLGGEWSSFKDIKEKFLAFYSNIENTKKTKNDFLEDFIFDYYVLNFSWIINDNSLALRDMEHNRWYIDCASRGRVPMKKKSFTSIRKTQSDDDIKNICMTNIEGLNKLTNDYLKKTINSVDYNFNNVEECISSINGEVDRLFNLVFSNDVMGFDAVLKCLMESMRQTFKYSQEIGNSIFNITKRRKFDEQLSRNQMFIIRQKKIDSSITLKDAIVASRFNDIKVSLIKDKQDCINFVFDGSDEKSFETFKNIICNTYSPFISENYYILNGNEKFNVLSDKLNKFNFCDEIKIKNINSLKDIQFNKNTVFVISEKQNINDFIDIEGSTTIEIKTLEDKSTFNNFIAIENIKKNIGFIKYGARIDNDLSTQIDIMPPCDYRDWKFFYCGLLGITISNLLTNKQIESTKSNYISKNKVDYEKVKNSYNEKDILFKLSNLEHIRWAIRTLIYDRNFLVKQDYFVPLEKMIDSFNNETKIRDDKILLDYLNVLNLLNGLDNKEI